MYCVYLTLYFGKKLPKRYIGSTSIENISKGYNGSVKSKKYKNIYLEEQQNNKHLFKTRILSRHDNQNAAIIEENRLHKKYNVVKSEKYINMSTATINGCFGRDVSGINHPMYNKCHDENTKHQISETLKRRFKNKEIISSFASRDQTGENNGFYNKKHSEESKQKMRKPKCHVPKFQCPHCEVIMDGGNLKQHIIRKHS